MHLIGEIVVQKFGGAALKSIEEMKQAARIVATAHAAGRVPCVVVSAMGKTTDDLIAFAHQCGSELSQRELDALLACGESMSAPLFAICLQTLGVRAVSLSGAQAGIATTDEHGHAMILKVNPERISVLLSEGAVPVIAGFQGYASTGDVTTLGRGGSDLTAVALGAALGARVVELYKDVDGIYERDPSEHADARRHERLDYDALLAILTRGDHHVLQQSAVEYAKKHRTALRVIPFGDAHNHAAGTLVKHPSIAAPSNVPSKMPSNMPASMKQRAVSIPPPARLRPPSYATLHAVKAPDASAPPRKTGGTAVFEERESKIRGYCRSFPAVFAKAKNAIQWDESGRRYIDFFAGAGALNYGHNPEAIKARLTEYLASDGVVHALDMYTPAKRAFLETFRDTILEPRGLDYKVQFCGPTGANSVEAALKLARLATGRTTVASFTGGWHGMTAACLSVCGNRENREAAGTPLPFTTVLPYPVGPYQLNDALGYVESLFEDPNSGLDLPAAMILETLQGEGGIYVAPTEWLRGIRALCDRYGVLLIADDVQVGCGRTGSFFSFERAGIVPDIVCLSKSIGGYGLPMALLLMRPEIDVWEPGQHTGTFRGNQLAFVAATAALENWKEAAFADGIAQRSRIAEKALRDRIAALHPKIEIRGAGLMWGIDVTKAGGPALAKEIGARAFQKGLIIERCGRDDTVMKVMPPLTIETEVLTEGLTILEDAMRDALADAGNTGNAGTGPIVAPIARGAS